MMNENLPNHNEPYQSDPQVPTSERQVREELHGVGLGVEFETTIESFMRDQPIGRDEYDYTADEQAATERILDEHGIVVDPHAAPTQKDVRGLTDEDWVHVATSSAPVMSLWSKAYLRGREQYFAAYGESANHTPRTSEFVQSEAALFRSLPLLHSTSFLALHTALSAGAFKSNRQLADEGIDVTAGIGHTHLQDREVGLDGKVFADFGRPSSNRAPGEVTVVLEPEAMFQQDAFLTERDLLDLVAQDSLDYRRYMRGAVLPEDFYAVGLKRLLAGRSNRGYYVGRGLGANYYPMELRDFVAGSDSDPDQSGATQFSTWEVKVPEISTSFIRKVIFTDLGQYQTFMEEFGDQISCTLVDPSALKGGVSPEDIRSKFEENMTLFGTEIRYKQELAELRNEDYVRRQTIVGQAERVSEGYMLINHPDPHASDAIKYDPTWYRASRIVYDSADQALSTAREEYDPTKARYNAALGITGSFTAGTARQKRPPMPKALIWNPEITIAKVKSSKAATIIEELSVEDVASGVRGMR